MGPCNCIPFLPKPYSSPFLFWRYQTDNTKQLLRLLKYSTISQIIIREAQSKCYKVGTNIASSPEKVSLNNISQSTLVLNKGFYFKIITMNFETTIRRILTATVLLAISCTTNVKEYRFADIGWTIKVPNEFEMMDDTSISAVNELGKAVIANQNDSLSISNSKTLFCIRSDNFNYLSAAITPLTGEYVQSFDSGNKAMKDFMYTTMKQQMHEAQIDTVSSHETVNNTVFDRFDLNINFPYKPTMSIKLYSAIVNQFELGITVAYVDESIGKKFTSIIQSSSFK